MSDRLTIARPREPGSKPTVAYSLPEDLLEKARGRVRLVALLCLAGAALDPVFGLAEWLIGGRDLAALKAGLPTLAVAGIGVGLAGALYLAARSPRLDHWTVLHLGLGFEVATCLYISVAHPWLNFGAMHAVPQLNWATPLIILFPLLIPCPPRRMLAFALASAATVPLGLWIAVSLGPVVAEPDAYLRVASSPLVAAGFAYFGSRVVFGLGLQVSKERRALEKEREMGSYRLEERLGSGGMGEVWKATHRLLARPAAIKLVRPEILGDDESSRRTALQRFELEAQATASMRSPHTIELYDFGFTDEGTFYYVMELLDGLDLESLVKRFGPVSPERTVELLGQMCHSLAEAHEADLIHRDIKPANVYACRFGREVDFVKVLDFGLVKSTGAGRESDRPAMTGEHVVVGTPAFMAPEQVLGQGAVDGRTDIYAVGCVGYWLLTGEPVFRGDSVMETLMHHVKTDPVPPSARSELEIPASLDAVIIACLEKDPGRRPASSDALAAALGECLDTAWTQPEAHRWWATNLPVPSANAPR